MPPIIGAKAVAIVRSKAFSMANGAAPSIGLSLFEVSGAKVEARPTSEQGRF